MLTLKKSSGKHGKNVPVDHYGPAGRSKLELKKPAYENFLMDVEMILVREKVDENSSYMASFFHTNHHNFTVNEMR